MTEISKFWFWRANILNSDPDADSGVCDSKDLKGTFILCSELFHVDIVIQTIKNDANRIPEEKIGSRCI